MANHNDITNHDRYGITDEWANSAGYVQVLWCRDCGALICGRGVIAHDQFHQQLEALASRQAPVKLT